MAMGGQDKKCSIPVTGGYVCARVLGNNLKNQMGAETALLKLPPPSSPLAALKLNYPRLES